MFVLNVAINYLLGSPSQSEMRCWLLYLLIAGSAAYNVLFFSFFLKILIRCSRPGQQLRKLA